MTIGNLIKARRIAKEMTLEELSQKLGVSAATISRWESGKIENMRRSRIKALSDVLDIPVNILMGWESAEAEHREPTSEEWSILDAFRNSPEFVQKMVLYILGLSKDSENNAK